MPSTNVLASDPRKERALKAPDLREVIASVPLSVTAPRLDGSPCDCDRDDPTIKSSAS